VDQNNNSNYPSEDNPDNQNPRPANPYLRPKETASGPAQDPAFSQSPGNSFGDYIPAWPAPGGANSNPFGANSTSGNTYQNPYLRNQGPDRGPDRGSNQSQNQDQTANPYQSPYGGAYRSATPTPEPAYKTAGGSYSYTNTNTNTNSYTPNAAPATNQPRRVILGATMNQASRWTQIILGIIVVFFAGQLITGGGDIMGNKLDPVEQWGMLTFQGVANGEWWRLVTSMFLHAGILHILFNGMALYALGMQVELLMGSKRFLLIFFLTGIGGNVLTLLVNPVPSVGASGGIFGLLGALIAFFYRNRDRLGAWGQANLRGLLLTAGINFVITFSIPQVNQMAHIGGLVTGLFLGYFLSPWQVKKTIGAGTQAVAYRLQDWAMEWWSVPALVILEIVLLYMALQGNGGTVYRFR
jgi:rhomboid protease GluP